MPDPVKRRHLEVTGNIVDDLQALHSRLFDDEDRLDWHSKDIAAIMGHIQALSKRLAMCEEILAYHCGFEVNDLRDVAVGIKGGKAGEESNEIGVSSEIPGD